MENTVLYRCKRHKLANRMCTNQSIWKARQNRSPHLPAKTYNFIDTRSFLFVGAVSNVVLLLLLLALSLYGILHFPRAFQLRVCRMSIFIFQPTEKKQQQSIYRKCYGLTKCRDVFTTASKPIVHIKLHFVSAAYFFCIKCSLCVHIWWLALLEYID